MALLLLCGTVAVAFGSREAGPVSFELGGPTNHSPPKKPVYVLNEDSQRARPYGTSEWFFLGESVERFFEIFAPIVAADDAERIGSPGAYGYYEISSIGLQVFYDAADRVVDIVCRQAGVEFLGGLQIGESRDVVLEMIGHPSTLGTRQIEYLFPRGSAGFIFDENRLSYMAISIYDD